MSNQFLKLRRSSVPGKVPTTSSLEFGEIALNTYDGLAFIKKSGSSGEQVVPIGFSSSFATSASYALTASYALNAGDVSGSQYFIPVFSGSTIVESTIYQSGSFVSFPNATQPLDPNNPDMLFISASGVDTYNLISAHADRDGYVQLNIQNFSLGNNASSDIVASANNGTENSYYIDMGINGENYANNALVGFANDAYIFSTGNDLLIGNASQGHRVVIFNGGLDAEANAKVFVHDQGTVSINTNVYNTYHPAALYVKRSNEDTFAIIQADSNIDDFTEISNVNASAGTFASADILAYNDLDPVSQSEGYVDLGINSSNYAPNAEYPGLAGDAYLYTDSHHLVIGSVSQSVESRVTIFAGGVNEVDNAKLVLYGSNYHVMTGSLNASEGFTGSLYGTASWALNVSTASFVTGSSVYGPFGSNSVISSSYSLTASYALSAAVADVFPYTGSAIISGSLTVTGSVKITGSLTASLPTTSDDSIIQTILLDDSGSFFKRQTPVLVGDTFGASITSLRGKGTITVTNGSATVTGTGTNFTDSSYNGINYWRFLWVYDGSQWYRALVSTIASDTSLTANFWYNQSQIQNGYISYNSTFQGNSGTYEYYIIKNYANNNSFAGGNHVWAENWSFAFGGHSTVKGGNAFSSGIYNVVNGLRSAAIGQYIYVSSSATGSFAGGGGTFTSGNPNGAIDRRIYMSGSYSFIWSQNDSSQTAGHGVLSNNSAILGGINHNIPSTSPRSAIIGGNAIKADASRPDTVYIPNLQVTGSGFIRGALLVTGSITGSIISASQFTGSLFGTSSWSRNASTASSADSFVVRQDITASNALITGTITAQTLVVQVVTSSIAFVTGSTKFGSQSTDTHQFTGSLSVSGSLSVNGPATINNLTGSLFGTSSWSLYSQTASFVTASNVYGPFGSNSVISSSYALTASFALNAGGGGSSFPYTGSAIISGSLEVTGSVSSTGGFTGSLLGTASWSQNAVTASFVTASNVWGPYGSSSVLSSSFALTASYVTGSVHDSSNPALSASYALSSSFTLLSLTSSFVTASNVYGPFGSNSVISSSYALTASYVIGGASTIGIEDEGSPQGSVGTINFVGAGVTATVGGGTATITIPGGGAGSITVADEGVAQGTATFLNFIGSGVSTTVTSNTASIVINATGSTALHTQPSPAVTWSFNHNLGNLYPVLNVWDSNGFMIMPGGVKTINTNSLEIYFDVAQSGYASAVVGGTAVSASYALTASYALNGAGGPASVMDLIASGVVTASVANSSDGIFLVKSGSVNMFEISGSGKFTANSSIFIIKNYTTQQPVFTVSESVVKFATQSSVPTGPADNGAFWFTGTDLYIGLD